jgi:sigma-E factor negative regulatory protein RseC
MLESRAIVIQVQGEEALVQPLSTGGCGHCDSEGGCGSGTLSKMFCSNNPRHFKVRNDVRAKVGDEVQVSLPDGALLRGAMKMYMLPLLLLLIGGIAGGSLTDSAALRDAYAVAGALAGMLLGFILARLSPGGGQPVASSIITSIVTSRSSS